MGTPLSPVAEGMVLDALLPDTRYISLHTSDPGVTGSGEIEGNGYVRQIALWHDTQTDPTHRKNSAVVQFPTATAPWGTIGYFGVWTAESGGQFLGGGVLDEAKSVGENDSLRFPVDSLTVMVD